MESFTSFFPSEVRIALSNRESMGRPSTGDRETEMGNDISKVDVLTETVEVASFICFIAFAGGALVSVGAPALARIDASSCSSWATLSLRFSLVFD
jgi:hypothetical protein